MLIVPRYYLILFALLLTLSSCAASQSMLDEKCAAEFGEGSSYHGPSWAVPGQVPDGYLCDTPTGRKKMGY
jgi:hypothetical protein